jgi:hypothetical protein
VAYQLDSYNPGNYGSVISITLSSASVCELPDTCLNGGNCRQGKCSCVSPYFGTQCQYQPVYMDSDTYVKKFTLEPYQVWFFREDTKNGEPDISFELRSNLRPPTLLVMNIHPEDDQNSFYIEQNTQASQIHYLSTWTNTAESRSIQAIDNYFSMMITNLASGSVNYQLTITRIRSNTYSIVSKILLYLLLGVIALLVVFSIITTIIRRDS